MLSQQEGCSLGNLVAGACALGGRGINHALIALTIGIELIVSQRGNDDTRADGVDTGTTFLPTCSCGALCLQMVHALGNHVGKA